jgi:hypothetical protein
MSQARNSAECGSGAARTLYCSFCFKSQHDVEKLLSGHGAIFICGECVEACNEIMAGRSPNPSKQCSESELPTERLQGKGDQLQAVVDLLRSRDVSWARIGAALGISRQSAWERFS